MRPIEPLPSTSADADIAIEHFSDFQKIRGMIEAVAVGFPTLPGIIVNPALAENARVVLEATLVHPSRYLIRHDRRHETGRYHQGGYIITREQLSGEMKWHAEQDRMMVLLAPADPIDNLYSASAFVTARGVARVEVVGPGFDASDINRGNITPMESFEYVFNSHRRLKLKRYWSMNDTEYEVAQRLRIRKIALKFLLAQRYFDIDDMSDLEAMRLVCRSEIARKPQIERLLNFARYRPAPAFFTETVQDYLHKLADRDRGVDTGQDIGISISQVENGNGIVVWDIVHPRLKYTISGVAP